MPHGRIRNRKPVLLIKKMFGMLLLVLGFLFTATGFYQSSAMLITLGVILLAAGIGALILKITRRNDNYHR